MSMSEGILSYLGLSPGDRIRRTSLPIETDRSLNTMYGLTGPVARMSREPMDLREP